MNERQLAALAAKAIKGDVGAFEKLYAAHVRSILLHVRSLIFDKENSYDVAQEAVFAMYKNIHRLKNPAAFRGWMHQVIRSTCYDHNGKVMRTNKHEDPDDYDEQIDTLVDEDIQTDPEAATMAKIEGNRLFALVNELPEAYREVLAQRYYDDMTYKEIAEAQGITVSNVSTRLQRATEALRKKVGETGGGSATPDKGNTMREDQEHTQTQASDSSAQTGDAASRLSGDDFDASADIEYSEERTPNDIEIDGAGSLKASYLSGAAMLFPSKPVSEFLASTNAGLSTMGGATTASAAVASKLSTKVLIAIVSVVVVVAVAVTVWVTVADSDTGNEADNSGGVVEEQTEIPVYSGTMHLEFIDENGVASDRNVTSITLVEDEAAAVSTEWKLYWVAEGRSDDESGEAKLTEDSRLIASGSGYEVDSAVLTSLEPGFYLAMFTLTDANDAYMDISRNFVIAE